MFIVENVALTCTPINGHIQNKLLTVQS